MGQRFCFAQVWKRLRLTSATTQNLLLQVVRDKQKPQADQDMQPFKICGNEVDVCGGADLCWQTCCANTFSENQAHS